MNKETTHAAGRQLKFAVAILATLVQSRVVDAALEVTIDPAEITSADTFDLRALHRFGSTGYERLEQSITFNGSHIDVYVLMEAPYEIVLPVVTPHGAFFTGVGPLDPGTYYVDAEMWMRKRTFAGYQDALFSTGSLTFDVLEPHVSEVLPGDYNGDGEVNAADYVVWRTSLGSSENLAADGDGSGTVDEPDYAIWRSHSGQSLESSTASTALVSTVPEPVPLSMAAATAIFFLHVRTQYRRRSV